MFKRTNLFCFIAVFFALAGSLIDTQAQLAYRTEGNSLIVTGYAGSPSNPVVVIPSSVNGLPVVGIDTAAFRFTGISSVTLPDSVINIGDYAFEDCNFLTNVDFGHGVINIGDYAFDYSALTNLAFPPSLVTIGIGAFQAVGITTLTLPDSVQNLTQDCFYLCTNLGSVTLSKSLTSINAENFYGCSSLASIQIPAGITNFEVYAFGVCANLRSLYFHGNAPAANLYAFYHDTNAVAYYLPGATGWSNTLAGIPARLWNPAVVPGSIGIHSHQFGFSVSGTNNFTFVIRATTNLTNPIWTPLITNTLGGSPYSFTDPQPANLPSRFYEVAFP